MTSPKIWIATAAFAAALASSPAAFADGRNEVRAVTFDEDGAITRIHVRGASTPTFTVYKLERPSRVVIDLPQAMLGEAMRGHDSAATFSPGTWAVSTIAAQQLDDGGQVVRVSITLARPGRYDVKTDGNEVVIMVTARDPAPKTASPEALAAAQAQAHASDEAAGKSRAEADAAKQQAAAAQADAERLRKTAEAAQRAADDAKKQSSQQNQAAIERARADAARAQDEAAKAKQAATAAQAQADSARDAAEHAKQAALADADHARAQAASAQKDADAAKSALKATAAQAQTQVASAQAEADQAKSAAAQAKADAAAARSEADQAKADAARARTEAAADKRQAEADKRSAEATRGEADKTMRDAKQQLATLDKKIATAQELEDRARSTHAAAEAREEAAREAEAQANRDRLAAEDAARRAAEARDRSSSQAKSERERLVAEAHAAEERLARAKAATDQAEAQRTAAEAAVGSAKQDLEHTRGALASVEQQRTAAESAASEAARKRSEAEAAATDASRRRTEAETAASVASKKRSEAEAAASSATKARGEAEAQRLIAERQRVAAEDAARTAAVARDAADKQRQIAETAAGKAQATKAQAEGSLAELTERRVAAEKAATEVEARTKAAAKAQAELAAAEARKAGDAEVAAAKHEAARLADERKQAETELADRRKAVSAQQAEAARLRTVAGEARDAADREETRRARLADARQTEEKELARIQAQKADAEQAVKVAQAAPVAPVSKASLTTAAAAKISAITFAGDSASGRVDIAVAADAHVTIGEVSPTTVELVIDNADLAQKLERTLDVTRFGGPVRSVSSFRDATTPNRVRLVATLATPATPSLARDGSGVHWQIAAGAPVVAASAHHPAPAHTTDMPATVVGGFGASSTPVAQQSVSQVASRSTNGPSGRRVFHGAAVDFDFKDAPIHDLLRTIAEVAHISIVVPDQIEARVTVRLKHVPWDQALEVILSSHGLWYRREGNLYRIESRKVLDAEDEAEAARRASMVQAEAPRPDIVTLNYASATELKLRLVSMLSPKGHIEVESRTNALIINDVAGNREQIIALALRLDTQTPQISIEARIVEADTNFTRQIGIQWGGHSLTGAAGGNATGLQFPSTVGITGANVDANTIATGVANPSDFAVNIPAATGAGEGGALGLALGSIGGNFDINLRLSALEDTNSVRIISAPKVTVLNNVEAKISQGVSIPISVVSAAGTQTQFVQADLSLTVTPYVSQRDCAIAMKLNVTKNEPNFAQTGARGDPTITRKEAKTEMLVNDGETAVLGGIYTRNTGLAFKKIPWFGDLPVLGWLFKNRSENDDRTEVLVFITPKITNKASLHCQ